MRLALLLCLVLWSLAACAYRPLYGGDHGSWRVPIVLNETAQAGLTGPATTALRRRLLSAGFALRATGEHTLEVRIVEASTAPYNVTSHAGSLVAVDSEVRLSCVYRVLDAHARPISQERELVVTGLAQASPQPFAEQAALENRLLLLTDELAERLTDELALAFP